MAEGERGERRLQKPQRARGSGVWRAAPNISSQTPLGKGERFWERLSRLRDARPNGQQGLHNQHIKNVAVWPLPFPFPPTPSPRDFPLLRPAGSPCVNIDAAHGVQIGTVGRYLGMTHIPEC